MKQNRKIAIPDVSPRRQTEEEKRRQAVLILVAIVLALGWICWMLEGDEPETILDRELPMIERGSDEDPFRKSRLILVRVITIKPERK